MLRSLSIRNVVLIEQLDLDFDRGLSALTGQTGAGKSIILDALGMAIGGRSDKGLVRAGANKASSTAYFTLPDHHIIWQRLDEAGIDIEAGEDIMLRRLIGQDGRSRAFINDHPVSVRLLSEIGTSLLEVHGQHDGRGLLDPNTHITVLDQYDDLGDLCSQCASAYNSLRTAGARVEALSALQGKADEERAFLEHAIGELDRLDPQPNEDETLAQERRFLQMAEQALQELSTARQVLEDSEGFEARLSSALGGIERISEKLGPQKDAVSQSLTTAAQTVEKTLFEIHEARAALSEAALHFDIEQGRLEKTEERLFSLRAVARKYGCSVTELNAQRARFSQELNATETVALDLSRARQDVEEAQAAFDTLSSELSDRRRAAAARLERAILDELPPLKMENARFDVVIDPSPASANGRDKVRFQVATNPGSKLGPLDKIASGGELARFMLAIKVCMAGRGEPKIMIFDEVDQGIGGAVADAVGRRLQRLANGSQVFVVTHSPQVAACATHQFQIQKSSDADMTTTHVRLMSASEREEEIARMLAGENITHEARAAARKLMAS